MSVHTPAANIMEQLGSLLKTHGSHKDIGKHVSEQEGLKFLQV